MLHRRIALFALGIALQAGILAAVEVSFPNNQPDSSIGLGENAPVLVFRASNAGNVTGLLIQNSSTTVPFAKDGIHRVEIYKNTNDDGTSGTLMSSHEFTTEETISGGKDQHEFVFSTNTMDGGSTTVNYAVRYYVASNANFTPTDSTSKVYTNIQLVSMTDGGEVTLGSSPSREILVQAYGLIYLPGKTKSMLGTSSVIAANSLTPIYQVTLRAEKVGVDVTGIALASNGNFATSGENKEQRVRRVILLADNGDGEYGGIDGEGAANYFEMPLPAAAPQDNALFIPFSPAISLVAYDKDGNNIPNSHLSEKTFYVLYELGSGVPVNTQISCSLLGGQGTMTSGSSIGSTTHIPISSTTATASVTIKNADVELLSAVPIEPGGRLEGANGLHSVAGQKRLRMIEFTYRVRKRVDNVTLTIFNGGGSFRAKKDNGITRAYLYRDTPSPTLLSYGTISDDDDRFVVFKGFSMQPEDNARYFIECDAGVLMNADTAQMRISAISAPNAVFAGYLPAPAAPASTKVWPHPLWVGYVRSDRTVVNPGDTFTVDIGVFNRVFYVNIDNQSPPGGQNVALEILPGTVPVFYAGDKGFGFEDTDFQDISSEFTVRLEGYYIDDGDDTSYQLGDFNVQGGSIPLPAQSGVIQTHAKLRYSVTASNLKTNRRVYIDAKARYRNPYNTGVLREDVYLEAFYDTDSKFKSAAREYRYGTLAYTFVDLSGVTEVVSTAAPTTLPPYVDLNRGIYVESTDGTRRRFANGDMIPALSDMRIALTRNMETGINLAQDPAIFIYINRQQKLQDTDFFLDTANNEILIKGVAIGERPGEIWLGKYPEPWKNVSVAGLLSPDFSDNQAIRYGILGGTGIGEVLVYPSPYNPDAHGDLNIGFSCKEDGTYDLYIYNANGKVIFQEKEITATLPYSLFKWSGAATGGTPIGRGAYLVRVVFHGKKKQDVVTKFGVR
ncbi:hypothetical protein NO2_1064 [Candidatus Termititenax persephonae]|uniref:Uncharacterized protein n=1 Tax=Candidatus Termititenax persephonae TaxID=2218525 RepID=A0A388THC4_9BACT|nr:hypothetical protein NO2_1064 [Candidatus Termititenax persephonae]